MRHLIAYSGLAVAALTVGCGSLATSQPVRESGLAGVPYSLPKTVYLVDVNIALAPKAKEASATPEESGTATTTVDDAHEETTVDEDKNAGTKTTITTKDKIITTRKEPVVSEFDLFVDDARLELSDFRVTTAIRAVRVADPDHSYVLQHNDNVLASDELVTSLTSSGLLAAVNATARDETPQVIASALSTAANVAATTIQMKPTEAAGHVDAVLGLMSKQPETHLVPDEASLVRELSRMLGTHTLVFDLVGQTSSEMRLSDNLTVRVQAEALSSGRGAPIGGRPPPAESGEGIWVRVPVPARVRVEVTGITTVEMHGVAECLRRLMEMDDVPEQLQPAVEWALGILSKAYDSRQNTLGPDDAARREVVRQLDREQYVAAADVTLARQLRSRGEVRLAATQFLAAVPDFAPTVLLPLDRALFVEVTHAMEFQNGMLTKHSLDRPSTGLAAFKIAEDTSQKVLDLVTQLVELRINLAEDEAKLAQLEADLAVANDPTIQRAKLRSARLQAQSAALSDRVAHLQQTGALDALKNPDVPVTDALDELEQQVLDLERAAQLLQRQKKAEQLLEDLESE